MKKLFILAVAVSSVNAAQMGTLRKAATSAALAGSAAGLAWMGSPYFGQQEARDALATNLEMGTMPPGISGYLQAVTKPMIPAGKNITFTYHDPESRIAAEAFAFQAPGKHFISFPADARSIWQMEPQEGDAPEIVRLGMGPNFTHTLTHEAKHIIEDDSTKSYKRQENTQLGALGLSGLTMAGAMQNMRKALPGRTASLGVAVSPFYYFSTKFNEAYKARQQEMAAENFAVQHADDERLQELYNQYKGAAVFTNRFAYNTELKRFNNGEIDWDYFYTALTHPTGKDIYNMVVTEMKKRNIKPVNSDGAAVPELFSIQNATPAELQHLYDGYKVFEEFNNEQIYKLMWDKATRNKKKEDWLELYVNLNELTGRDVYDMIVAEMRQRGMPLASKTA